MGRGGQQEARHRLESSIRDTQEHCRVTTGDRQGRNRGVYAGWEHRVTEITTGLGSAWDHCAEGLRVWQKELWDDFDRARHHGLGQGDWAEQV